MTNGLHLDDISEVVIWSMVEGYVVLIAACVPTLPPVYDRFTDRSKLFTRTCPFPFSLPRGTHYTACFGRSDSPRRSSSSKQHFLSALKPSFGTSHTGGSANSSSRQWSLNGGGSSGGAMCTADLASPRTLEDAANLAYPPAAIWKQTVRVGQHSRLRSQDHESF